MKKIIIKKANGETEYFSAGKLKSSMLKAGANRGVANQIIEEILKEIRSGMTTSEIYRLAFSKLKKTNKTYAAKYSLRNAIMKLGPDGFPFEEYFATLLREHGFQAYTNEILKGKCIAHEIDVIAEKPAENIHAIIESKFHSRPGIKTGSKEALYTYARFLDVKEAWEQKKKSGAKPQVAELQIWLVTNTKLTTEAKKYCRCRGIRVIGWDFASFGPNLQQMIENYGLYPITVLFSLNNDQRRRLLSRDLVTCKQLIDNQKDLRRAGLSSGQISNLLKEVYQLINNR